MLQYKDIRSFSKFHPVDPTTGKSVKGKSYIKQTADLAKNTKTGKMEKFKPEDVVDLY